MPKRTGKKRISFKIKTNRPPASQAAYLFFLYTVTIIRFLYMQKYLSTTWRLWKLLKPFHKDFYIQLFLISCISVLDISLSIYIGKIVTASSTGVLSDIAKTVLFYSVILFSYWTFDFIKDFQYAMKVRRHVYQYLKSILSKEF